jgi:hypothetical protein
MFKGKGNLNKNTMKTKILSVLLFCILCFCAFSCKRSKAPSVTSAELAPVNKADYAKVTTLTMQEPPRMEKPSFYKVSESEDGSDSYANVSGESDETHLKLSSTIQEKKLIKTGSVRMEVAEYIEARKKILALVAQNKGYIASESETSSVAAVENKFIIRATGLAFDSIVENTLAMAKRVDSKEIKLDDVISEYVDLEVRLKSEKAIQKYYLDMLAHAKTVKDMLPVQLKIDEITEEIEAREGRLKLLNDQALYSTLELSIYQNFPAKAIAAEKVSPGFFTKIGEALSEGWQNLLSFFLGVIKIWPYYLIPIFLLILWIRSRMKRKTVLVALPNQSKD